MGANNRQKTHTDAKASAPTPMAQETNIAARHANDRLLYLMANLVGCHTYITLKNHDRFGGIFSAASLDATATTNAITLKMSKKLQLPADGQVNESTDMAEEDVGYGEDRVMIFNTKDIVNVEIPNVTSDKAQQRLLNGSGIRTDADISGNLEVKERQLEAWQDSSAPSVNLTMNGSINDYDQFRENENRFGIKSDYDESFYTTTIDRSGASYKERAARAEQIAREIECGETDNPHIAEERNLQSHDTNGLDEEAKYSGVARSNTHLAASNPNRYTPPARRAPTGHATVLGAPVDPAIISSSLAQSRGVEPASSNTTSGNGEAQEGENIKPETAQPNGTSSDFAVAKMVAGAPLKKADDRDEQTNKSTLNRGLGNGATLASRLPAPPLSGQSQTSKNLEQDVNSTFKTWAAEEKARARHHQAVNDRHKAKDRDSKINDLKKFAANFKLKTELPQDILGILARDKNKQKELQQKSKQELETQAAVKAPAESHAGVEKSTLPNQADRQATKGSRGPPQGSVPHAVKVDRSPNAANNLQHQRVPGNLGQRLVSQYGSRVHPQGYGPQESRMHQGHVGAINPETSPVRPGDVTPASAIRGSALSFKPNPMATPFQIPGDERSSTVSPARSPSRPDAKQKPINNVKLFRGKRPEAGSKRPLIEGFNPITRMRKEVEEAGKGKEFEANGGIPQAFRTAPTWPVSKENEEMSYKEIADKFLLSTGGATMGATQFAHQHQLPPHMNQGYYGGPRTPSSGPYRQHQPREYFDPHRMQHSNSQSSVPPSPSMRQQMMVPQQMGYRNDNAHMTYTQPPTPGRQFPPGAYLFPAGSGAPPMMMSQSHQGQFFGGMPPQGQAGNYGAAGGVYMAQGPPPSAFNSPRQAPMMIPQGQPQMQMPPQFQYQMQMAPGYPQPSPGLQMRGGMPMVPQGSYGSPLAYPMQQQQHRGGPNTGGGYPQQHFMQGSPMPGMPVRHPSDQSENR